MKNSKQVLITIAEFAVFLLIIVGLTAILPSLLGFSLNAPETNSKIVQAIDPSYPYPPPDNSTFTPETSIPIIEQTITPYFTPTYSTTEVSTPSPSPSEDIKTTTPIPLLTQANDSEGEILFFIVDEQKKVKLKKVKVDKEAKPKENSLVETDELPPSDDLGNIYFAPDGKYAVVLRRTEGLSGIVLDLKSGNVTEPLASFIPKDFFGWFPDSKHILVSGVNGLWLVDPLKKDKEISLASIGNTIGYFAGATGSPDGKWIVYSFVPSAPGKTEIWKVNDKGGEAVKMLEIQDPAINYAWSPNGGKIAFRSGEAYWVMNADGTDLKVLDEMKERSGIGSSLPPVWSPDSKLIIVDTYGRPKAGGSVLDGSNIFIINTDNGEKRTLFLDGSAGNLEPSWSPDGRFVTFVSNRSGKPEIWIIQADGSSALQITNLEKYLRAPYWLKP